MEADPCIVHCYPGLFHQDLLTQFLHWKGNYIFSHYWEGGKEKKKKAVTQITQTFKNMVANKSRYLYWYLYKSQMK